MTRKDTTPVYIFDYDPEWPVIFHELATIIGGKLGPLALRIEHVGSTSVPGLPAKPIIDLDVVTRSTDDFNEICARLDELGYQHEGDHGVKGREAFGRIDETVPYDGNGTRWMNHHLYVCGQDAEQLRCHLVFRDALRASPELHRQYAALKRELARKYRHDRDAYVEGKTEFVVEVLRTRPL